MAKALGAEIIDFNVEDPVESLHLTGGTGVDRAIDAVGVDAVAPHSGAAAVTQAQMQQFQQQVHEIAPQINPQNGNWHPGNAPSQSLEWAVQPQPAGLEARTAQLRQSIERIAPFAPGTAFIVNTGAPPKGNIAEAIEEVIRQLRTLSDLAADCGVRIALEPLNASAMNAETAIWTVSQALNIVDTVDHSNVGICLDLWNNWQDAGSEEQIRQRCDRIFALQVSDWRTLRSSGDRIVPGRGCIPLGRLLHAMHDVGYRDVCTVEIFSQDVPDSLYDTDLHAVVQESRKGLDVAWRNAQPK